MPFVPEIRIRAKRKGVAAGPITTGKGVYVDGRTAAGRRFANIAAAISADLGGVEDLTETQRLLISSIASTSILKEAIDCKILGGQAHAVDTGEYCNLVTALRRLLVTAGFKRVAKDVGAIDLRSYLGDQGAAQ
jgi:hypothetical protein